MNLDLHKKRIVVTGGAGRIGGSVVWQAAEAGAEVIVLDLLNPFEQAAGDRENVFFLPTDLTDPTAIFESLQKAHGDFGQIDAAVHAAYPRSAGWGTAFEALESEFLAQDLFQQMGGGILFSQGMCRHFAEQGYGNLIHISSIQGIAAPKFEHYEGTEMVSPIEYSAIKAGIIAITRYLAKYYRGRGIRVNCVSPGGIRDNQPEDFLRRYRSSCNEKGMLDPEDITGAILFLLSDASRYMTGQNLVVDDGWSL
mgnify:CR=1 FL=1